MSLTLIVNGQSRDFETLSQPASLEQLVTELGLKGDRVAVEHNGEIVPRALWAGTILSSGDRLEVVHFVGGGAGFTQDSSSSIVRNKSSRAR
jgi:sulfur carrier protein